MAELDPSLILQTGNYNDPGKLMSLQAMAQQLKTKDQEQQQQNSLRQLLQRPGAIGPNGLPTASVVGDIARTGNLGEATSLAQANVAEETKTQAAQQKRQEYVADMQHDATEGALSAYDDAVTQGLPPTAAQDKMQQYWTQFWDEKGKSGLLHPEEMPHQTTPSEPFLRNTARSYQDWRQSQQAKDTERERQRHDEAMENRRTQTAEAASGGKWSPPTEVEINDGKGGTKQLLAQQNRTTGQWATADETRTPIPTEGMRIIKDAAAGGREGIMQQRMLVDAKDVTSELQNITEMPISASGGWLGSRGQTHGLMNAPLDVLANQVTPQDVQSFNTSMVGMGRALAGMETGGMQVNGELLKQFEGLKILPGDTNLTRLQKMATMRQQAENALEGMLASPRLGKEQKALAQKLITQMGQSIPFTVSDVLRLGQQRDGNKTLGDLIHQSFPRARAGGASATRPVIGHLPDGTELHPVDSAAPAAMPATTPTSSPGGRGGEQIAPGEYVGDRPPAEQKAIVQRLNQEDPYGVRRGVSRADPRNAEPPAPPPAPSSRTPDQPPQPTGFQANTNLQGDRGYTIPDASTRQSIGRSGDPVQTRAPPSSGLPDKVVSYDEFQRMKPEDQAKLMQALMAPVNLPLADLEAQRKDLVDEEHMDSTRFAEGRSQATERNEAMNTREREQLKKEQREQRAQVHAAVKQLEALLSGMRDRLFASTK